MREKLLNILGFTLFLGIFIIVLPFMMLSGAIVRPLRFFTYTKAKVNDQQVKEYFY